MAKKFDYEGAKQAGYSDEEILSHLSSLHSKFDVEGARQAGYSPEEINQHLASYQPKRSVAAKAGRLGMQAALSTAERAAIPYEVAVAPLASKEAQHAEYRKHIFEDIERLQEQKQMGIWDEADQKLYDSLVEQIKHPEKAEQFVKTGDLGIRGLVEKATGIETRPEGALEKAVSWTAFIKKPSNVKELIKMGTNPKEITKAIMPTGKETLRGLGAGTALQMAEDNQMGPIGTMAAAIVGDLAGAGGLGALKGIGKAITRPTETLAKGAALLANRKNVIKRELAAASQGKEFTRDLGTLTNNNTVRMIQSRLAASGLTGKPLEDLRKTMIKEIVGEYESIAKELGEARFETLREAGEIGQDALKSIRDAEKSRIGQLYEGARNRINEKTVVSPVKLASSIRNIKQKLSPGALKSTEQKAVVNVLETLEKDLYDASGELKPAKVEDLINNKIALNDIINYEVQGGQKQLLKELVQELDKAIISHGRSDPEFLRKYVQANKDFSQHAKDFRNPNINKVLMTRSPEILMDQMNSVQGIKDLRKALSYTPEGRKVFNDLARKKMDMVFGKTFKEGIHDQLKLGRFSNLLSTGKNKEIMKELLSKESYSRLERLQKHAGDLAETANKFFNASQSATALADLAGIGSIFTGIYGLLTGNPWALFSSSGLIGGSRWLSGLIADPEFLKLTEEAIVAAQKNNINMMSRIANEMTPMLQEASLASAAAVNQ